MIIENTKPLPLVRCYVRLIGNQVDIWPRPVEIQAALRSIVSGIEGSCKSVLAWGMDGRKRDINEKTLTSPPEDNEGGPEGTSITLGSNSQACEFKFIHDCLTRRAYVQENPTV